VDKWDNSPHVRSLLVGEQMVLDSANSVDQNEPPVSPNRFGQNAGFTFEWQCLQTAPVLSLTACPLNLSAFNNSAGVPKFAAASASSGSQRSVVGGTWPTLLATALVANTECVITLIATG
jgi:hypothetical protein